MHLTVNTQGVIWDKLADRINAYFEEHDVIFYCVITIIRVFAFLHNCSHCPSLPEIVGAQNNPCQSTAKS